MKVLLIIGIVLSSIRFFWAIVCFILVRNGSGTTETLSAARTWALGFFPSAFYIVVFSIALAHC